MVRSCISTYSVLRTVSYRTVLIHPSLSRIGVSVLTCSANTCLSVLFPWRASPDADHDDDADDEQRVGVSIIGISMIGLHGDEDQIDYRRDDDCSLS